MPDFKTLRAGDLTFVYVESDRLSGCLEYYKQNKLDGLLISKHHGYKSDDISFLKGYAEIKAIYIQTELSDISGIYYLNSLNWLLISELPGAIDLSPFPHLDSLNLKWNVNINNLGSCKRLRRLSLRNYNPKNKNLLYMPKLDELESLALTQSNVESLEGINVFPNVRKLEFHYLPKLIDIQHLASVSASLEYLEFDHCKKINYNKLVTLQSLKTLLLGDCGDIPSINFIKDMPALERFAFVGTNISDGDMLPLLKMKSVGFLEKKHYSHTQAEIEGLIKKK